MDEVTVRMTTTLNALVGGASTPLQAGQVLMLPMADAGPLLMAGYATLVESEAPPIEVADDVQAMARGTATGPGQRKRKG
jgi:hypothetical protein